MSRTHQPIPTKSVVQRRTADSYGNRGKSETPQARGGSPPSPRKAADRSGTKRPIYGQKSTKKEQAQSPLLTPQSTEPHGPHSHQSTRDP
jgi:hypothetical protein